MFIFPNIARLLMELSVKGDMCDKICNKKSQPPLNIGKNLNMFQIKITKRSNKDSVPSFCNVRVDCVFSKLKKFT